MQKLEEKIRKNSSDYVLVKRGDHALMYAQYQNNLLLAYEVFEIRMLKAKKVFGDEYPEREHFPGNECFGSWAWSIKSKSKAFDKLNEIEENGRRVLRDTGTH